MRVAIIGTRDPGIPQEELVARFQAVIPPDAIVTSGNATGTDQVSKAWLKNIQYLPWDGYNEELGYGYRHAVVGGIKIYDDLLYHLFPWILGGSSGLLKLVRRNFCIVTGRDGNQPVDAVYYYAKESEGTVSGGTAYAVVYARSLGIPTFNLRDAR